MMSNSYLALLRLPIIIILDIRIILIKNSLTEGVMRVCLLLLFPVKVRPSWDLGDDWKLLALLKITKHLLEAVVVQARWRLHIWRHRNRHEELLLRSQNRCMMNISWRHEVLLNMGEWLGVVPHNWLRASLEQIRRHKSFKVLIVFEDGNLVNNLLLL